MPSKRRPIQFRLPWLRDSQGDRADKIAKAILEQPSIQKSVEEGKCPICGKPFEECEYFKRLDD